MSDAHADLREAIASHLWYHTMELAPGITTPGWFDLRPILDRLPWPDLRGKRCLDVGTYDGFLAFEMERRGASEVIAIDIDDHNNWDWPPDVRATGGENLAKLAGPEKGRGFRIAKEALKSNVDRRPLSAYDLEPGIMGTFDVVSCGSLMLHLRDPLRALEAIRTVCSGVFLSIEQIDLRMSVRHRRKPVHVLNGSGPLCQWFVPNTAGHKRMVFAAGFEILQATRPYVEPFGVSHPPRSLTSLSAYLDAALQRVLCGGTGVPHAAVLSRPRV
jgi:tRNA (mo5U34)-methyltransferase